MCFNKTKKQFVYCRWTKQGPMFSGSTEPEAFDAKGVAACNIVRDLDTKKYASCIRHS